MKGASERFHFLLVLAGGPGSVPPALVFSWPRPGLPGNVFRGRAVVFHLSEHFRDRNALGLYGAQLPSWWDVLQLS